MQIFFRDHKMMSVREKTDIRIILVFNSTQKCAEMIIVCLLCMVENKGENKNGSGCWMMHKHTVVGCWSSYLIHFSHGA